MTGSPGIELTLTEVELREVECFIYREARLADESRYKEWESLWDDDGIYWVPLGDGQYDRQDGLSILNDNRARIASRIRQLETGKRFAQVPASNLRRLISNIEATRLGANAIEVEANFMVLEMPLQSTRDQRLWGGRVLYRLRRHERELKMFHKRVMLVNAGEPLPNLSFLI